MHHNYYLTLKSITFIKISNFLKPNTSKSVLVHLKALLILRSRSFKLTLVIFIGLLLKFVLSSFICIYALLSRKVYPSHQK